jgi:hypothetical protein
MISKNLKIGIVSENQEYIDKPVYAIPKKASLISRSLSSVFNGKDNSPKPLEIGHERVKLRWLKPDANGNLVHKNKVK